MPMALPVWLPGGGAGGGDVVGSGKRHVVGAHAPREVDQRDVLAHHSCPWAPAATQELGARFLSGQNAGPAG